VLTGAAQARQDVGEHAIKNDCRGEGARKSSKPSQDKGRGLERKKKRGRAKLTDAAARAGEIKVGSKTEDDQ